VVPDLRPLPFAQDDEGNPIVEIVEPIPDDQGVCFDPAAVVSPWKAYRQTTLSCM
jgi:hypothetical protein